MRDPKTGNVPNESKLQRALMPNSRMFLLFLIVFAVLTFFFSDRLWLSIGEAHYLFGHYARAQAPHARAVYRICHL